MKKQLLILSAFFVFISCTKKDEEINETSRKWQLVKMTGSFTNSVTVGEAMAWQEFYLLNADSTFTKSREQGGINKNAFGSYKKKTDAYNSYLVLNYTSGSEIMASCGDTEILVIQTENSLYGNWGICDGPTLEYKRVNQ